MNKLQWDALLSTGPGRDAFLAGRDDPLNAPKTVGEARFRLDNLKDSLAASLEGRGDWYDDHELASCFWHGRVLVMARHLKELKEARNDDSP